MKDLTTKNLEKITQLKNLVNVYESNLLIIEKKENEFAKSNWDTMNEISVTIDKLKEKNESIKKSIFFLIKN